MKRILFATATALCLAAPGHALTFTETTDFAAFGTRQIVGTTSVGTNTISGNLNGICTPGECDLSDSANDGEDLFDVIVGAGQQLNEIRFATSGTFIETYGIGENDLQIVLSVGDSSTGPNGWFSSSTPLGGSDVRGFSPRAAGQFSFRVFPMSTADHATFNVNWTLTLTTEATEGGGTDPFGPSPEDPAPVPLPAGLPLLLTALGGAALLRRRARRG